MADERPAILVVLVDPPDAHRAVSETWEDFPGVPILVASDSTHPFVPSETGRRGWVDTVTSDQSLQDICWLVLEAVSRAAHVPGLVEHPLGPHRIDVDGKGVILAAALTPDVAILAQPLIAGGPIVGRHINNRDPITGLLTRRAMSRLLVAGNQQPSSAVEPALIYVVLDDFEAISHYIGHRHTDDVLLQVALSLNQVFPHPSLTSRLMGDTFLACARHGKHDEALRVARGRGRRGTGGGGQPGDRRRIGTVHQRAGPPTDGEHGPRLVGDVAAAGDAGW